MIFADFICKAVQKKAFALTHTPMPVNNEKSRSIPSDTVRSDGTRYVSEIPYDSAYPNHYLDILYCPQEGTHPTLIYFHGGGFVFGDKVSGDPLAARYETENGYLFEIVRRGYNLVNVNYALAPEYRYPIQIQQMNEAISYCIEHADELHIDMKHVFVGGGSAGAIMAEMYGLAVVDESYASALYIKAALPAEHLCGLIIDESATDYRNFHSMRMALMFHSWMGTNCLNKCKHAVTLDVPKCIKDKYPACCIITSNLEHFFPDAALQLKEKLDAIGGDYVYFYRPQSIEKLEHGFVNRYRTSPCAREALELMMNFMENHKEFKKEKENI